MSVNTITITEAKTYPIRIDIKSAVANGYFIGHGRVLRKDQFEELRQQVVDGEFEGKDEELLRALYDRFEGFGDGDGFAELLSGPASAYLYPAATAAYFEHFGEARRGNSKTRRGR